MVVTKTGTTTPATEAPPQDAFRRPWSQSRGRPPGQRSASPNALSPLATAEPGWTMLPGAAHPLKMIDSASKPQQRQPARLTDLPGATSSVMPNDSIAYRPNLAAAVSSVTPPAAGNRPMLTGSNIVALPLLRQLEWVFQYGYNDTTNLVFDGIALILTSAGR